MRIERVTARAFGSLAGETLELAPGMTVVAGPNESGKSTWHAALRAAVCGIRRGRGAGTKADGEFARSHRPWDNPDRWEVEALLALDDGRRIEISQDLAGKVACHAIDVGLGRDVSDEIMDGTPDASRWLGLDRDAFAATICVNQAQILAIAQGDTAATLQEHMQRAAATRGTDATAAEALERLRAFRRDNVGVDRIGARGPLRAARTRLEAAHSALEDARRRHEEFLDACAQAEAAEREAGAVARRVALAEAALAARAADAAVRRAERAAELAARHPSRPPGAAARDELADMVAGALDAWERRPRPQPLAGSTSVDLEREFGALPELPTGDTAVHPSVAAAQRELEIATEALQLLGPPPDDGVTGPQVAVDEEWLRRTARRLRTPPPDPAPRLEAELAEAHAALRRSRGKSRAPAMAALAVLGVLAGAAALAITGQALLALIVLAAVLAAAVALGLLGGASTDDGAFRVARAEAALAPIRAAREHARRERLEAASEAAAAGLPGDADALEALADAQVAAHRRRAAVDDWDKRKQQLDQRRAVATAALRRALTERGASDASFAEYEAACRRRAEQAALAARAEGLVRAIEARRAAERGLADAEQAVARADAALREAALAAGIEPTGVDAGELVGALRAWRSARSAEQRRADDALAQWQELAGLLEGRTVDALREEATERVARAEQLAALVERAALAAMRSRDDLETLLAVEREEHARVQREADSRAGAIEQMRLELPDVAEAEEQLADAQAEALRVNELAGVLDETLRLLRAAEERVHRDLAPILAEAVRHWLPVVSAGAYTDATVDPADLGVRVKEASTGRWREALRLSEGTRELIYLLLRVAMAQHLVTTGETAPLLLDEVTAQADRGRAQRLLEVLHALSAERQIVLFTHDEEVARWAERAFTTDRDCLVQLAVASPERREALV